MIKESFIFLRFDVFMKERFELYDSMRSFENVEAMELSGNLVVIFCLSVVVNCSSPLICCVGLSVGHSFHEVLGIFIEIQGGMMSFTEI